MAFRTSFIALAGRRTLPQRIKDLNKTLAQSSLAPGEASTSTASPNAVASSSRLLPHFKVPIPPQSTTPSFQDSDGSTSPDAALSQAEAIVRTNRKYYIVKPRSGEWPVYSRVRNGGAWTTIIKGIKGDVEAFQRDVNQHFLTTHIDPLTRPSKATIRSNTLHIYMKGHVVAQVKDWMTSQKL